VALRSVAPVSLSPRPDHAAAHGVDGRDVPGDSLPDAALPARPVAGDVALRELRDDDPAVRLRHLVLEHHPGDGRGGPQQPGVARWRPTRSPGSTSWGAASSTSYCSRP